MYFVGTQTYGFFCAYSLTLPYSSLLCLSCSCTNWFGNRLIIRKLRPGWLILRVVLKNGLIFIVIRSFTRPIRKFIASTRKMPKKAIKLPIWSPVTHQLWKKILFKMNNPKNLQQLTSFWNIHFPLTSHLNALKLSRETLWSKKGKMKLPRKRSSLGRRKSRLGRRSNKRKPRRRKKRR